MQNFKLSWCFQANTVPKVGQQPEQATAAALPDRWVPRPKERQVCPFLRNLLKIKWVSN